MEEARRREKEILEKEKLKSRKRKILTVFVIALIIVGVVVGMDWLLRGKIGSPDSVGWGIYINSKATDDGWIVSIADIIGYKGEHDSKYPANDTAYELYLYPYEDDWDVNKSILNIKNKPSPYNVTWIDTDDDDMLGTLDYFVIGKSGGVKGNVSTHSTFKLYLSPNLWESNKIYLPPVDLVRTTVNKMPGGWNLTVRWVNESESEQKILEQTGFRLENYKGEFLTTHEKNEIVGEWYTIIGLRAIHYESGEDYEGNMGYYNITWYDYDNNQKLSVNDSIIIDNNKGLVETGFTFKFTHMGHYGAVFVMEEIILP
jgi:hypothetical protein